MPLRLPRPPLSVVAWLRGSCSPQQEHARSRPQPRGRPRSPPCPTERSRGAQRGRAQSPTVAPCPPRSRRRSRYPAAAKPKMCSYPNSRRPEAAAPSTESTTRWAENTDISNKLRTDIHHTYTCTWFSCVTCIHAYIRTYIHKYKYCSVATLPKRTAVSRAGIPTNRQRRQRTCAGRIAPKKIFERDE